MCLRALEVGPASVRIAAAGNHDGFGINSSHEPPLVAEATSTCALLRRFDRLIDFSRAAQRLLTLVVALLELAPAAIAASTAQPPQPVAEPLVGVVADPCTGVSTSPTAAHQATVDPYNSWMTEWRALDWGQRCRYWRENAYLPAPSRARVVFLGDSITEAWQASDPGLFLHDILDRGISGQTTAQMLVRFRSDVIELRPRVVHIMAGTNDIAGNTGPTSLAVIEGNIESMVEQAQCHDIQVMLASIPPAARIPWSPGVAPAENIVAINAWLRNYAKRQRIVFGDYYAVLSDGRGAFKASLSDDGVHPNAAGYIAMGPLVRAGLKRVMSEGRHAPH
jgi:lysophospholipase L1-like esterase